MGPELTAAFDPGAEVRRRLIQPLFTHTKKKNERNGSVFMLTHNDWFH